jgi:succinate dehydrogenase / fumarate reductase iron-sulfur subunit
LAKNEGRQWSIEKLTFRIQRYEPDRDRAPHIQEFVVPFNKGMTVLDALLYIKENLDSTLAFRTSCRMGICGSCGMMINGFPRLACHTPIGELGRERLEIRPLPNFAIIKDLVTDLVPLFQKHSSIKPYIMRPDSEEVEAPTAEFLQSREELEGYLQFTYCTKCGICLAACPTVATDGRFLGPQSLTQAYRYCTDSRDGKTEERIQEVDNPHGVWLCHLAGACSQACPKGVDPALSIQLLKRTVISRALRLRKEKEPSPLAPPQAEIKQKIPVPEFTAKQKKP